MPDHRGLTGRCRHRSDLAGWSELPRDLDAEVGLHRIAMVIDEDVVSISPQSRLRAQECPNLIERRPPDIPHSVCGNLAPDRSQQSRRNDFDLDVWTHSQKCGSGRRSMAERISVTA